MGYNIPEIVAHPFFAEEQFEIEYNIRREALLNLFSENTVVKLELTNKKDVYYIIHPAIKSDLYQATYFYKDTPMSDFKRDIHGLVQELINENFKVVEYIPKNSLDSKLIGSISLRDNKQSKGKDKDYER